MGQVRPCRDGGCSVCNAADDRVGKGRCNHYLDGDQTTFQVRKQGSTNFIDISSQNTDDHITIEATETNVTNYLKSLSTALPKDQHDKILKALRGED